MESIDRSIVERLWEEGVEGGEASESNGTTLENNVTVEK